MICKVPYRLLFPLLAWHGVKIILRDERLFNVGLSWSVFQGHVFPFPVLYFCNMTYEYCRSKRQLESFFFSILSKGNNLLKIVWNIPKFVIRLHLYKIKVGHEYISWIHTLDYLINVPNLLSVPADKFPKISVRLLDRE